MHFAYKYIIVRGRALGFFLKMLVHFGRMGQPDFPGIHFFPIKFSYNEVFLQRNFLTMKFSYNEIFLQ